MTKQKYMVRLERTVTQYIDIYIYVEEGYDAGESALDTLKQPLAPPVFGGGKKEVVWSTKDVTKPVAVDATLLTNDARPGYGVLDLSQESSRLFTRKD